MKNMMQLIIDLTRRRAIKEGTIAINLDWVYNQAWILSHGIHGISQIFYNV